MSVLANLDRGRRRVVLDFCVLGLACVGLAAGLTGYRAAPAAGQQEAADTTVIKVTAGKPNELTFTLSKSSGLPFQAKTSSATVSFRVANKGELAHGFKVCTTPVKAASLITCKGTATKILEPGQSATLTIGFKQRGAYEYLSSVPGEAANGMRGLIGIGVGLETATPTTTKPVTTAPTTTSSAPSGTLTGAAAAGAAIWAAGGCGDCHSVSEVWTQSGGNITLSLNQTHSGGPFRNGPLNATQMQQLAAFLSS